MATGPKREFPRAFRETDPRLQSDWKGRGGGGRGRRGCVMLVFFVMARDLLSVFHTIPFTKRLPSFEMKTDAITSRELVCFAQFFFTKGNCSRIDLKNKVASDKAFF